MSPSIPHNSDPRAILYTYLDLDFFKPRNSHFQIKHNENGSCCVLHYY